MEKYSCLVTTILDSLYKKSNYKSNDTNNARIKDKNKDKIKSYQINYIIGVYVYIPRYRLVNYVYCFIQF